MRDTDFYCGTIKGYQQHLSFKEVTCPECRKAWREYVSKWNLVRAFNSPHQRLLRYLRGDLG